jgi:Protein of unknown function (DUF3089)
VGTGADSTSDGSRAIVIVACAAASHSLGTYLLRRLVREEIDRRPRVRRRLVSALLLGGDVVVRTGSDRGGDFRNISACCRPRQIGCVVAYSAFGEPPPPDARYGKPTSRFFPAPGDRSRHEVLYTNPARLSGDRGNLLPYFPTGGLAGPVGAVAPPPPDVPTPWAAVPGLYRGHCAGGGGADWPQADQIGRPADTRRRVTATLGPTWGLQLVDVDLAYGNLVELVRRQAAAFPAPARPSVRPPVGDRVVTPVALLSHVRPGGLSVALLTSDLTARGPTPGKMSPGRAAH